MRWLSTWLSASCQYDSLSISWLQMLISLILYIRLLLEYQIMSTYCYCGRNVEFIFLLQISGRGPQYVQKKRTIYPEWNTCFDAHLYEGRVINIVVMEKPNRLLAEVTVPSKSLAQKCTDGNIASIWVCICKLWKHMNI